MERVVAVLSRLSASDAAGQSCDNSCVGGVCSFEGLQNVPTGDATLSIDPQCDLLVSDIGASGNDGEQWALIPIITPHSWLRGAFSTGC